jgi:dTDP-4-dehydrorhamnose 3,5-epimerase-like enzyme/dTDP-4-dehydrorhamnose reductase
MQTYSDHRGSLTSIKEIPFDVKEILISKNNKGVLRGLHMSPYRKRVFVTSGTIHDFFINPVTHEKTEITLSSGEFVDIPKGWAHGFFSVTDSQIVYLLENRFDPTLDQNIFWNDPTLPLERNFPKETLNISEKDRAAFYARKYDFLVLGARGFLGSHCVDTLRSQGYSVFESNERLENIDSIREQILKSRTSFVICAAGISGKPTVEWCETHEKETIQNNYTAPITLFKMTEELGIHCTYFGSGLVYSTEKDVYTEDDTPTLTSRVYCRWRCELEKMIPFYKNVLYLRILYPITGDDHPKCFLTKMLQRTSSVADSNVSITVVPSLFPSISELCKKDVTGIYNFVNKNSIRLPRLLELYGESKERVEFTCVSAGNGFELSVDKLSTVVSVEGVEKALYSTLQTHV